MSSTAGLFSHHLLSPTVAASLPEGYILRALRKSDCDTGFLDCLRVLTTVGEISDDKFGERYDWLQSQDGYYILVVEDTSRGAVVGTGALIANGDGLANATGAAGEKSGLPLEGKHFGGHDDD
ncbi:hypothetical protein BN1723_016543 [Verticillium longisporum]|uniref:Glucosamine 6-phosphate N-acetyltransferase n=1 Tax=Verticillium longisporum TaxID=100787 RepID=A0A0G4NG63_VERLO|nr:hypothetical protein BN1723_016543 [Verticillium longisporum]